MTLTWRSAALWTALALALAGYVRPVAAQSMVSGSYVGTTGSKGGVTLTVSPDGTRVTSFTVLDVPGKMLFGTCSGDFNLNGDPPFIVGGHFDAGDDQVAVSGSFSADVPGYVTGSVEVHARGFLGLSAHQPDPNKREARDECNIAVKLDWSAKARDLSARVAAPTVVVLPSATPTVTAAPTAEPTPTAVATLAPVVTESAVPAPAIALCTAPAFGATFASLKQAVGDPMGQALDCERQQPNGDILQPTTTGLSYFRAASGTLAFTDGTSHWALTPDGLVTWTGDSVDPTP